jgi:putative nucleotidyltransferase with HDIG domain
VVPSSPEARREALFRDLAVLGDLPPAPRTLGAVWQVLEDDSSSATALADVLQQDPALAAKVLRLANSAYFGLPRPVAEVRAACVILGFGTVRAIAVGVMALDALSRRVEAVLDLGAFWRHSVGVATAAQALARRAGLEDTGAAFCAGVLHDVGKLVLATIAPDRYRRLGAQGAASSTEAETAVFGADHAEAGAWLGARWHFPAPLLEAIRTHHQPASAAGRWGALVRLADGIAYRNGCACPGPGTPAASDPALLERLLLTPDALASVERGFAACLERVEAFTAAARSAG